MSAVWYVLWFIVAVSLLVTVHEFGHYWVARRLGFKVLRFSVGFGKPLFKRVAGADRTEYVIAWIPLGGYVKMLDEREGPVDPDELHRSFTRRPHWQRIAVLLAGPGFNFAFAILVLAGMLWVSGSTHVKPIVGEVKQDSYAARAGLQSGDEILSIDGRELPDRRDVVFGVLESMSTTGRVELTVGRDGARRNVTLTVDAPEERVRLTEPNLLLTGLGFEFWQPFALPSIGDVTPGGPGALAGLQKGDLILSVDGKALSYSGFAPYVAARPGESLLVRYRRGAVEEDLRITPVADKADGKTVGRIQVIVGPQPGVGYPESMFIRTDLSPLKALGRATTEAWDMTVLQARLMWRMALGQVSLKNISGPVSIAQFAGESAEAGVTPFLGFLVLISLALGFLNLLPIPILDGGQIVFQLAEWLKGSPLSERAQLIGQQIGIGLLVLLMGLAFYNDITARLFNN